MKYQLKHYVALAMLINEDINNWEKKMPRHTKKGDEMPPKTIPVDQVRKHLAILKQLNGGAKTDDFGLLIKYL